jgi:hypothetical protein
MTTTIMPYRIQYNRIDHDYTCYVTIDDVEQTIGSRPDHTAAEKLCRDYLYDHYTDNHTPEAAAQYLEEPEPALPEVIAIILTGTADPVCEHCGAPAFVSSNGHLYCKSLWQLGTCDGPGGWQGYSEPEPVTPQEPARRSVSAGWDREEHSDLNVVAAQMLLPLAHLSPVVCASGDYILAAMRDTIPVPANDHAIVCDLIDALNAVAAQLPVQPTSISASMHIDGELYLVQHNGPPRQPRTAPAWANYHDPVFPAGSNCGGEMPRQS